MKSFDTKRTEYIKRKNDIYFSAEKYFEESEKINRMRNEVADSKNSIPNDLPYETKSQIETYYKARERELEHDALELANKIRNTEKEANEVVNEMTSLSEELVKKAGALDELKKTPLVGTFLHKKGKELKDQAEQIFDLAEEARMYSNKLEDSRTRALKRPR